MRYGLAFLIFFSTTAFAAPPDLSLTDDKADPCQDFYKHACGGWLARASVLPSRPYFSRSLDELNQRNEKALLELLAGYAKGGNRPANTDARRLGDYYNACLKDEKDETAMPFLLTRLKRVQNMQRGDFETELAWLHVHGVSAFFALSAEQDYENPSQLLAEFTQTGLGLPSPEYYLDPNDKTVQLREQYRHYLTRLFEITGRAKQASRRAADVVLHFETRLAEASLTSAELRDPQKLVHKLKSPAESAPGLDWTKYFKNLSLKPPTVFNVTSPKYLRTVDALVAVAPVESLRAYMEARLIEAFAWGVPGPLLEQFISFKFKELYGVTNVPPKSRRCADEVNQFLGFALSRAFVDSTLKGQSRDLAKDMVRRIQSEMASVLLNIDWMDAPTRAKAFEKIEKMNTQVAAPEVWRRYDGLKLTSSHLQNRLAALAFNNRLHWAKIGQAVNASDWPASPASADVWYSDQSNRLTVGAGLLQPPFFEGKASSSANYAAVGRIIAHELSHAFDDRGSQFDSRGQLANWWSPISRASYYQRAQCVAKQFHEYPAGVQGQHVDGILTLAENVADQAGLKLAYSAWHSTLPEKLKPGSSAEREEAKKFFLAYAQNWCTYVAPDYESMRLNMDPQAPERYRVNGSLMNFPEFARAFACKAGSSMAPQKTCAVW